MKLNKSSPINFFITLPSLFAFTLVTFIPTNLFYLVFIVAVASMMVFFTKWHLVDRKLLKYIGFFLLPSLIGLFSYPISMILTGNVFDYDQLSIFGRIANLTFLFLFILILHSYIKDKHLKIPFLWYWFGIGVLMFTALWQFADVFLHLVSFPFETRSHLHSTYGVDFVFSKRLTGIAREPSYFVMFAIDFIILSILFSFGIKRLIILGVSLLLMILSLSPSGYITFAGAFVCAYIFTQVKYFSFSFNLKSFLALISVLFILPLVLAYFFSTSYFDYFYNRVADPRMWESARAYMSYKPFVWAWDSNLFSFLFGHGIKSYSIIGTAYNVPSGGPVHVTSNNLYVDTFWEAGLLGLIAIITFFVFVLVSVLKSKKSKLQIFIALFVLFDLVFSSLFRADFASFRYFILLYLVYVLIHYDLRKVKGFYV